CPPGGAAPASSGARGRWSPPPPNGRRTAGRGRAPPRRRLPAPPPAPPLRGSPRAGDGGTFRWPRSTPGPAPGCSGSRAGWRRSQTPRPALPGEPPQPKAGPPGPPPAGSRGRPRQARRPAPPGSRAALGAAAPDGPGLDEKGLLLALGPGEPGARGRVGHPGAGSGVGRAADHLADALPRLHLADPQAIGIGMGLDLPDEGDG